MASSDNYDPFQSTTPTSGVAPTTPTTPTVAAPVVPSYDPFTSKTMPPQRSIWSPDNLVGTSKLTNPAQAVSSGFGRGVFGDWLFPRLQALDVATEAPLLGRNPVDAFNEELKNQLAAKAALEHEHPEATRVGQDIGLGTQIVGAASLPLAWGARTVTGALTYLAKNAALGGVQGFAETGTPGGAAIGAGAGSLVPLGHMIGSAGVNYVGRPIWNAASQLFSGGARETSIGTQLGRDIDPTAIQPEILDPATGQPMGPTDIGQRTGNAAMIRKTLQAQTTDEGAIAANNLRTAQQNAIRTQLDRVGANMSQNDAATALTRSISNGRDLLEAQEDALWQVPALQQTQVQTTWLKNVVHDAIDRMPVPQQAGYQGALTRAIDMLDRLGPTATVGDINAVRSLLRIGGQATEQNPYAPLTRGYLQNAFDTGMNRTLGASTVPPAVQQAWTAARDFTYNLHNGPLNFKGIQTALDATKPESVASTSLFNFDKATPEGPQAIVNLANQVRGLGTPEANLAADNMVRSARSYVASELRDIADTGGADVFKPGSANKLRQFLANNSQWMQRTGLLDQNQITSLGALGQYLDQVGRTAPGQSIVPRGDRFVDHIVSPALETALHLGGLVGGYIHGGLVEAGGAALGSSVARTAIANAQNQMTSLMTRAVFDPEFARTLLIRATPQNRALLSPWMRQVIDPMLAAIPGTADVMFGRNAGRLNPWQ